MYAGFTIHQFNRNLNAFGEPQPPLHGWRRTIARNADGVEAMSYDTTARPDVIESRVLFWPKEQVNAIVMDKWRAVQTTRAMPELSPHGFGERSVLFHCEAGPMSAFTELFSGCVELKGVSFAHVIRTNRHGDSTVDAYYWKEADCFLVQEITSRFAGEELIASSGWDLDSIENGKSDPNLFEIPNDYREGSIIQFRKEFLGEGSTTTGFFNEPADPYKDMMAARPAP